jgi:cation diffusion facilitator CzcD-associated flavoprotein CzcO
LAAAKAALDAGLQLTVFEAGRGLGGNWRFSEDAGHSSVFETTHIISSKMLSRYHDFPMPADYPDYPSHAQLLAYFESYAHHFGVSKHIQFDTRVIACTQDADASWHVTVEKNGAQHTQVFDALMVANGHHYKPRWPEYPGNFTGEFLHSHSFKRAAPFAGKRVLVIGGGNSAADIAVETSRVSAATHISWRRGYWIVPKFLFGQPPDVTNLKFLWMPPALHRWVMEKLLTLANGKNSAIGLPDPDHRILQTHPLLNSELYYFVRHGKIRPHGDIARFDGNTVHFKNGDAIEVDTLICATGYWIEHPFFDKNLIDFSHGPVPLYLRMLPANIRNLYFIGLFQPLGCIWPAAELQAKIAARHITGAWQPPGDIAQLIAQEQARPDVAQVDSPRHTITVADHPFRQRLYAQLPAGSVRPLGA